MYKYGGEKHCCFLQVHRHEFGRCLESHRWTKPCGCLGRIAVDKVRMLAIRQTNILYLDTSYLRCSRNIYATSLVEQPASLVLVVGDDF
jgi:hypothetical protein